MQVPWEKKYLAGWGYMLSHDVILYIVASTLRWERQPQEAPGWYAGEGTNLSSSFHAYTSFEDLLFAYCWPACPHSLAWCRAALGGCHGWAHRRAVAGGRADGDSFIPAFLLLSLAQHALYRVQLDFECRPQHARTHIECLNRNIKYS